MVKVSGWWLLGISASTAFAIAAGGVFLTGCAILGKDDTAPLILWIASAWTGLIAAARDTRGLLALPPVDVERPGAPGKGLP